MAAEVKDSLERLARRLRVPCHPREWAIKAMQEGKLPEDWPPGVKDRRSRKRTALEAEIEEQQQQEGGEVNEAGDIIGLHADAAAAAAANYEYDNGVEISHLSDIGFDDIDDIIKKRDIEGSPELVRNDNAQEEGAGNTHGQSHAAVVAATRNRRASAKGAAAQEQQSKQSLAALRRSKNRRGSAPPPVTAPPEGKQPPAKRQRVPSPQLEVAPAPIAAAQQLNEPLPSDIQLHRNAPSRSPAPVGFSWEGEPVPPPHGAPTVRKYYNAVVLGSEHVSVGSFVELAPPPGETAPRVAQVTALWAERGVNGEDRPYGRFLRYFRPQDTPLGLPFLQSAQAQVFKSAVEEQMPLAAVVRRCTVSFPNSVETLAQATPTPRPGASSLEQLSGEGIDYVCMLQYDYEQVALTCLPPHE